MAGRMLAAARMGDQQWKIGVAERLYDLILPLDAHRSFKKPLKTRRGILGLGTHSGLLPVVFWVPMPHLRG